MQYTHRPNTTELGMGNTHETYMLVNSDYDISKIFPVGVDIAVEDTDSHKMYNLKSANGREFRVNQMGEIYRDHDVRPGDEITITSVSKGGPSKVYLTVKNFNRVVVNVGNNGAEIFNLERLDNFRSAGVFEVSTYDRGQQNKLVISFKESRKKRSDSPNTTDFYNAEINGVSLSNGTYYLTLGSKPSIVTLVKSSYNEIMFEDNLIASAVPNVSEFLSTANIDNPYRPYITAIKSKPFLLLAGISGTGKSRIVRELARACWEIGSAEYKEHKPKNFEMVQVKPNWHDSSELIGYMSRIDGEKFVVGDFLKFVVKAWEDPETPYFLCLDEMNLAPVEQYFAEYLSVVESRKSKDGMVVTDPILKPEYKKDRDPNTGSLVPKDWYADLISSLLATCPPEKAFELNIQFIENGISIPQNLVVIGTVNMDETTFSFSRKVLDRAMTIEMNEVNLWGGLSVRHEMIGKLSNAELVGTAVEGVDVYSANQEVCDKVLKYLDVVNRKLEGTPFKIAYRTRNEFLLYVVNNIPYNKDEEGNDISQDMVIARALDEITNMKILSRIEGDETKVPEKFLKGLSDAIKEQLDFIGNTSFAIEKTSEAKKSISLAKLNEMNQKLSSGYTSFWS